MEVFNLNKHVYLSDLDSVCNSKKEMKYALDKILYENIVLNGDIVVLSFNQLADSNFIMSFLNDDIMKEVLINLFECGRIVVSKYKSGEVIISSAVRYIMQQIDKKIKSHDNDFIFSAVECLNIKNNKQKEIILNILKETLVYNDLNYLDNELSLSEIDIDEKNIKLIKNYAEFLIRISLSNISYISEKNGEITKFTECIDIACSALKNTNENIYNELSDLKERMDPKEQSRSKWIKKYTNGDDKPQEVEVVKNKLREVEVVIDTCYNLAVESSISQVTSIDDTIDKEKYFIERYNQILNNYQLNDHQYFLFGKNIELYEFTDIQKEYWQSAIRIIKSNNFNIQNNKSLQENIKNYRTVRIIGSFAILILTLLIIYSSGFMIDVMFNKFKVYVRILGFIFDIIAIILGDAIGYLLNIPNSFELFANKSQKYDMKNCKNIIKYQYYDKEVQRLYVTDNNK